MVGKVISHYRILEKIGAGGMGDVYKAQDTKLGRHIALKFLPPELTRDTEARERFIHEAKAASALQHANICTIHDIDETDDGQLFISMDCYEGATLKQRIERGPLSAEEAIRITLQVAYGLERAHEAGIIHRDIKPPNIMITSRGDVKILDFGLAKLTGGSILTKAGSTVGTVEYMSPEQARAEICDQRTDLWSLGVVMYEMLTGGRPFASSYPQAVIYAILNQDPKPPAELNPSIPQELQMVVLRALAKDPQERYQTCDEMIRDLELLLKGEKLQDTARFIPRKKFHRRFTRTTMIVALTSIAVILIGTLLLFISSSPAVPFMERGWIVISDFENTTGEEVFDKALTTAFSVSIEQSRYVNVVPRRRLREVLRRMKKEDVTAIGESTAREIALREGLNIIVIPGISKIGAIYALTWKIEDAKEGFSFKSGVIQAHGQEEILPALDEMTRSIRRTLGESFFSVMRKGKPLSKVTTSSLEALRQYSLGIESHRNANIEQARIHYTEALRIDSTFIAARASLGMLLYENFDENEGKKLLSGVVGKLDDLTDKERYGILAFHARAVEINIFKAADEWKTLLDLYPDYSLAHYNLGWIYFQKSQFQEAVAEYKEALRTDPTLSIAYYGLLWTYLYNLGEIDSALTWSKRQLAQFGEQAYSCDNLGYAYIGKDSLEQGAACFRRVAELNPKYTVGMFRLSDTYRMLGKYREAIPPLEKILQTDSAENWALYELGLVYRVIGDEQSARRYLGKYRRVAEDRVHQEPGVGKNYITLGVVLSRLGDRRGGWAMGQKGMAIDSNAHFELAQLLSILGRHQEAIDQLELAIQGGFQNYVWIKMNPDLWDLRNEPRFTALLHRVLKG